MADVRDTLAGPPNGTRFQCPVDNCPWRLDVPADAYDYRFTDDYRFSDLGPEIVRIGISSADIETALRDHLRRHPRDELSPEIDHMLYEQFDWDFYERNDNG